MKWISLIFQNPDKFFQFFYGLKISFRNFQKWTKRYEFFMFFINKIPHHGYSIDIFRKRCFQIVWKFRKINEFIQYKNLTHLFIGPFFCKFLNNFSTLLRITNNRTQT